MTTGALLGTLVVLLGGFVGGSFALPLKFAKRWSWENSWAVYSLVALLIVPWIAAIVSVPHLCDVLHSVATERLLLTILFGIAWGVANVLCGLAIDLIGMAISIAVVVGMSAALGCLIPFLLLEPQRLNQHSGHLILLGVALTLCGVALLGVAGRLREKSVAPKNPETKPGSAMAKGLLFCVLAGVLAPMLNFSFAFGRDIVASAIKQGAHPAGAANAVWALALFGGFISNAGYCIVKLTRQKTWGGFAKKDTLNHWFLASVMGVLWIGGTLLYGWGATALGNLGAVIGWPVFQATTIIFSSLWGLVQGEWRNSDSFALRLNFAALALLVVAIAVLGMGNHG
jgi:L-rhamnose-H+ transport protein